VLVVASALVLLAASTLVGCNGSGGSYSPMAPTGTSPYTPPSDPGSGVADVTISIVGMNGALSYSPNPATVKVGQTVAWRNADSVSHTATADAGAFDTGTIAAGAKSSPILMATAGSFPYHCAIHGFAMTGTLVVTP
jgi:plastocyanin